MGIKIKKVEPTALLKTGFNLNKNKLVYARMRQLSFSF
jgi:hypothetical protein